MQLCTFLLHYFTNAARCCINSTIHTLLEVQLPRLLKACAQFPLFIHTCHWIMFRLSVW